MTKAEQTPKPPRRFRKGERIEVWHDPGHPAIPAQWITATVTDGLRPFGTGWAAFVHHDDKPGMNGNYVEPLDESGWPRNGGARKILGPHCSACGAYPLDRSDHEWWTCRKCGSEWNADHGRQYS